MAEETYDPTEGFRLLFPESKRPPIRYSPEDTAKIKAWLALPEEERERLSKDNFQPHILDTLQGD